MVAMQDEGLPGFPDLYRRYFRQAHQGVIGYPAELLEGRTAGDSSGGRAEYIPAVNGGAGMPASCQHDSPAWRFADEAEDPVVGSHVVMVGGQECEASADPADPRVDHHQVHTPGRKR